MSDREDLVLVIRSTWAIPGGADAYMVADAILAAGWVHFTPEQLAEFRKDQEFNIRVAEAIRENKTVLERLAEDDVSDFTKARLELKRLRERVGEYRRRTQTAEELELEASTELARMKEIHSKNMRALGRIENLRRKYSEEDDGSAIFLTDVVADLDTALEAPKPQTEAERAESTGEDMGG